LKRIQIEKKKVNPITQRKKPFNRLQNREIQMTRIKHLREGLSTKTNRINRWTKKRKKRLRQSNLTTISFLWFFSVNQKTVPLLLLTIRLVLTAHIILSQSKRKLVNLDKIFQPRNKFQKKPPPVLMISLLVKN